MNPKRSHIKATSIFSPFYHQTQQKHKTLVYVDLACVKISSLAQSLTFVVFNSVTICSFIHTKNPEIEHNSELVQNSITRAILLHENTTTANIYLRINNGTLAAFIFIPKLHRLWLLLWLTQQNKSKNEGTKRLLFLFCCNFLFSLTQSSLVLKVIELRSKRVCVCSQERKI